MHHFRLRKLKNTPHLNFYLCVKEELEHLFNAFEVVLFFEYETLDERATRAYEKVWRKKKGTRLQDVFDLDDLYMVVPLRLAAGIDWEAVIDELDGKPGYENVPTFCKSEGAFSAYISTMIRKGADGAGDPRKLYGGQLPLLDPEIDFGLESASMPGELQALNEGAKHRQHTSWWSRLDSKINKVWPLQAFPDTAYFAGRAHEEPIPVCMLCPNVGNLRKEDGCYPGCSQCSKQLSLVPGRSFGATLRKVAADHYAKQKGGDS